MSMKLNTNTLTFTRQAYVIRQNKRSGRVLRLHGYTTQGLPRMSRIEAVKFARRFNLVATFIEGAVQ